MPEAHLALRGELFWMKGLTDEKMVLFREEVTSYGLGGVIEGVGEGFGKGSMCVCVCVGGMAGTSCQDSNSKEEQLLRKGGSKHRAPGSLL